MKNIYILATFAIFVGLPMVTSCNGDAEFLTEVPENPVMRPIVSLVAMEQEDVFEGIIDDKNRTVKLEVEPWTDLTRMNVNLNIPKRAKLISPASAEGVWDLTEPVKVIVNNIERDVTFTVSAVRKAEFIDKPLLSLTAKAGNENAVGEINYVDNTVCLNFGPWVDLSQTTLTLQVKPHVKLVDPTALETVCDFSTNKTKAIVLNDVQKDVIYTLNVTQQELMPMLIDRTTLQMHRLDSDANGVDASVGLGTTDYAKLFDGKYMAHSQDHGAVGWSPFACQTNGNFCTQGEANFTIDVGRMLYLAKFSAHRYWDGANTQCTKFDLYGYCQDGVPSQNGAWDGWTLLGSFTYNPDAPGNFGEGDIITINKNQTKQARYYRVKAKETWFVTYGDPNDWRARCYTFTEFRFWEYK